MKRFILGLLATGISLSLAGCRKEDPNPELLDPIYLDLQRRAGDAQKAYDDEVKHQEELKATIEKSEPNTLELKNAQKDVEKSAAAMVDLEQKAHYYKIRTERRLHVDHLTYKAAFAKNLPWPDPHEYSEYLVNMRLQDSPRNWNIRVPKLRDRLPTSLSTDAKSKEKAKPAEE